MIVPYGNPAEVGQDSPHRTAWRIKDSAENNLVKQYGEEFEFEWNVAISLDEVLDHCRLRWTLTDKKK